METLDDVADPGSVLSIGALSRATHVPVETLRTWERRYGFPRPLDRPESGHRRYPLSTVERVRLAVRALDLGHKPSVALRASVEALRDLLRVHEEPAEELERDASPAGSQEQRIERWFVRVERFDGEGLIGELERAWNAFGAMTMMTGSLAPFLDELGERWETGDLEVAHEHFASEYVREFLSAKWRPLGERAGGARIVCATLSGEQHVLGLHMAATAMALAGAEIVFLGSDTPPEDVAVTVTSRRAEAAVLSAALGSDERRVRRLVKKLRSALPEGFPIAGGGKGFPACAGVELRPDLYELAQWARELRGGR